MPRSLAGLLFRILTDEANLCIFVLQISPDLNEVKVIWHEKDCVPGAVLIDSIPYFLGEKVEPGLICMLEGRNVRQPSQSALDLLLFTNIQSPIFVDLRQVDLTEDIASAILVKNEI